MARPARAGSAWRPAPKYNGAGNRCCRDADALEGPMAGLVGNIALAEARARQRAFGIKPCTGGSGADGWRGGARAAEVGPSNPLSSTN